MKKQIQYFLTALFFFTRIPCPKWVNHSPKLLKKSNRYFSLIGILVGIIASIVYLTSHLIFSSNIAILLSMVSSVWVTGAFHEDGFADVCDGFGGGWTKEKILIIMKDSTLGTFGVVGLITILSLKFISLTELNFSTKIIVLALISGHSISRFTATLLLYSHNYVREKNTSKINMTSNKMSLKELIISGFFGLFPLVFFFDFSIFLVLIPLLITYLYLGHIFKKWIGGQTGDCAGALQQTAEVVFYLSLLILWKLF